MTMQMTYSATARGFFPLGHLAAPSDAAPITNEQYIELLTAQSEGAVIEPDGDGMPVAVMPTPPTEAELLAAERALMKVSRFQARAALTDAGLLSAVEAAVADAAPLVQLAWAEAVEWRRMSPTIVAIGAALDLTETQLDDLFRAAALIEA